MDIQNFMVTRFKKKNVVGFGSLHFIKLQIRYKFTVYSVFFFPIIRSGRTTYSK